MELPHSVPASEPPAPPRAALRIGVVVAAGFALGFALTLSARARATCVPGHTYDLISVTVGAQPRQFDGHGFIVVESDGVGFCGWSPEKGTKHNAFFARKP